MSDPQQPSGWSESGWQQPPPVPPTNGEPTAAQPSYQQPDYQPGYAEPTYQQPEYQQPGYQQPGYAEPAYPQTGYGPVYGQPVYGQPVMISQPTNGLAIASMITAIIGLGPVAAIMGHVARRQIRERGEQGDGFALAGIIVGWVTTGIWVLCCGVYAVFFGLIGVGALNGSSG
jgi:hypothetical protein